MRRTVQAAPIVHKDGYNAFAENELVAYMRETLFNPLFAALAANGVPVDPAFQAIPFDEVGRQNATGEWVEYPGAWGSLGLSREEMPQIPAESRGALTQFLAARGIGSREVWALPGEFKPAQAGYWVDKAIAARAHAGAQRAILVSFDLHVLDGHHQWTAARVDRPDEMIRAIVFDAPIRNLVRIAGLLPSSHRENAEGTALTRALASGRVQYSGGVFSGKFSAATSRELKEIGATRDYQAGTWRIDPFNVPMSLKPAIAEAAQRSQDATRDVLAVLDEAALNIAAAPAALRLARAVDAVTADLGRQFYDTVTRVAPDGIGVVPEVSPALRATIEADYARNLELSVKGFTQEMVVELRGLVEQNALVDGGRTDKLAAIIESRFGVSRRKAEFLADQETGLLVSKYRAARYDEIGVTRYTWSTSHDARVRPAHRRLDRRQFTFKGKANVAEPGQPARYCNPGEDWRCRCVPIPLIDLAEIAA